MGLVINASRIRLRTAAPADADRAYQWLALSDLTPLQFGPPLYLDQPVPGRGDFDARYPPYLFDGGLPYAGRAWIVSADSEDIGVVVYGPVRVVQGSVELAIWLAEKRFCGHGYGSEALRAISEWLQGHFGIDRFVLRPSRRNVHALRALRRTGFRALQADPKQALQRLGLAESPIMDAELMLLSLPPPPATLLPQPQRTYVFMDSEFTDLQDPRLISVGAVATDATAFYCELNGWSQEHACDFAVRSVLPLLDGDVVPHALAAHAFGAWLAVRAAAQPVTIVTDSALNRWTLAMLFGGDSLPAGIEWQRVPLAAGQLDAVAAELNLRRHHALDDARGLRHALLAPGL